MPQLTKQQANKLAKLKALQRMRGQTNRARMARMAATRGASPVRQGRPRIEPIIHPLFDTEAITTGAGTYTYFARPIGQAAVSGNQKTLRDTNMRVASQLPQPQVQVVSGLRVMVSQVIGDTTASPSLNINPTVSSYLATIRAILWESTLRFFVGQKEYLNVPTMLVPGNVGISALGHAQSETTTAAETDWTYSLFSRGDYYSILDARIKLPPLQSFGAEIIFPVASKNTIAAGIKVTVCLDGLQGREVQ